MNTATPRTAQRKPATLRAIPTTQRRQKAAIPQGLGDLAELARLTIKEVCTLVGRSESSLREMIAAGRFPQPDYRDGPRCVRWSAGLVRRWLAQTTAQA
jgi:predicted DNA-binding transcriptional regulator AlpA